MSCIYLLDGCSALCMRHDLCLQNAVRSIFVLLWKITGGGVISVCLFLGAV